MLTVFEERVVHAQLNAWGRYIRWGGGRNNSSAPLHAAFGLHDRQQAKCQDAIVGLQVQKIQSKRDAPGVSQLFRP